MDHHVGRCRRCRSRHRHVEFLKRKRRLVKVRQALLGASLAPSQGEHAYVKPVAKPLAHENVYQKSPHHTRSAGNAHDRALEDIPIGTAVTYEIEILLVPRV
jgi:hypothetical protein